MITREEALNMAREAGIGWAEGLGGMDEFLEEFAKMVAAKEREACAETCEQRSLQIEEEQQQQSEPVTFRVGNLITYNQDEYQRLGDLFIQIWDGDDVAARVYGNDGEELKRRIAALNLAHPPVPDNWKSELMDLVSACQSSYHIDSTDGHRFSGLGSNLEENRSALIEYVSDLLAAAQKGGAE